jgi:hypothetical protein
VPDSNAISDVSLTLQTVLTQGLSTLTPAPTPIAELHDLQGSIPTSPARVLLFLFEAKEDPAARNRARVRSLEPPEVGVKKAPMAVFLRYLLIPWGGDRLTEHKILGRVLQILYDGAVLSGPQLMGGLAGTSEALKITLAPLTLEELTRVWYAVQKPYRLSLTYEVRVVNLESQKEKRSQLVAERDLQSVLPEVAP